jgi:hypothetical protein
LDVARLSRSNLLPSTRQENRPTTHPPDSTGDRTGPDALYLGSWSAVEAIEKREREGQQRQTVPPRCPSTSLPVHQHRRTVAQLMHVMMKKPVPGERRPGPGAAPFAMLAPNPWMMGRRISFEEQAANETAYQTRRPCRHLLILRSRLCPRYHRQTLYTLRLCNVPRRIGRPVAIYQVLTDGNGKWIGRG